MEASGGLPEHGMRLIQVIEMSRNPYKIFTESAVQQNSIELINTQYCGVYKKSLRT
jgi:hypothetical protein